MRPLLLTAVALLALPARAQKEELFGTGKAPLFREETLDRRFARSKVAKLLTTGLEGLDESEVRGCTELVGGLLTALAEVGPTLHKRDETFWLDPVLQEALAQQLSPAGFPALAYLASMVRKVMIERKLPDAWLATARALEPRLRRLGAATPDLAKLRMLDEGLVLADSAAYSIPWLKARYLTEALGATSAVTTDVVGTFRDTYLDRDVAWGGAVVVDVGVNQPPGRPGQRRRRYARAEPEELVGVLRWTPPEPRKRAIDLLGHTPTKVEAITLYARLQPRQYRDVEKLVRGQRVLVKGRFWEMNRSLTELELRDAVLFDDPDWSQGAVLGTLAEVAACPAAINELTGTAPDQPGGFQH
jgi:hypothetical protein